MSRWWFSGSLEFISENDNYVFQTVLSMVNIGHRRYLVSKVKTFEVYKKRQKF